MSYYDKEFKPWDIIYGKCVVADESEWESVVGLNERAPYDQMDHEFERDGLDKDLGEYERPIVKIITDIFQDLKGAVVDSEFRHMFDLASESIRPRDILTRVFQTIESTSHVDYLIPTLFPELVRDKWICLLYTSPSPRDRQKSRMPSSA